MTEKLKQLYQEVILRHSKNPVHFAKKTDAPYQLKAYNPLCGDSFEIYVEAGEKGLTALGFHGIGCAISKASASVMVQLLEKQSLAEAAEIVAQFLNMLEAESDERGLKDEMRAFQAVREYPGRKKCVSLAWEEMHHFLEKINA